MNKTQRAKLDSANRISVFNKKYEAELAIIPEYPAEQKFFDDALIIINAAAQAQAAVVGSNTDAVTLAKQIMANTTIKYALRATVKAKQLGNLVLASQLNNPITYLLKASKTQAIHRAREMRDNLNNNLPTLTNITVSNITEIDDVIAGYNAIKDNPVIDAQTKTATGTNPLPAAFKMLTESGGNMYNLVVSYFMDTNRQIIDEMALANQLMITGVRHNGLDGTVTKGGVPVFGATITIAGTKKTATTDAKGKYSISKIKGGDQTVTVTLADGSQQTKTATITKAQLETVDFEW